MYSTESTLILYIPFVCEYQAGHTEPFSGAKKLSRLFRGQSTLFRGNFAPKKGTLGWGDFLGAQCYFFALSRGQGGFLGAKEASSGPRRLSRGFSYFLAQTRALCTLFRGDGPFLGAEETFSGGSAFLPLFRGKRLPSLGLHMIALLIPGYVPSPLVNSCI